MMIAMLILMIILCVYYPVDICSFPHVTSRGGVRTRGGTRRKGRVCNRGVGIMLHPTSHQIDSRMVTQEKDILISLGIQELRLFLMIQLHH